MRYPLPLRHVVVLGLVALTTMHADADPAAVKGDRLDRTRTSSISSMFGFANDAAPQDDSILKDGLAALDDRDSRKALQFRDLLKEGSLDRRILSWAIALRGGDGVSSSEIAATAQKVQDWPGLAALRANSENALFREKPSPEAVIAAFARPPETARGITLLARAYIAQGKREAAADVLGKFWRDAKLELSSEKALLTEFGNMIRVPDHRYRMERVLYAEDTASAAALASYAQSEALQAAWTAVIRNSKDAPKLLDAVPRAQRSGGYFFARAKYLRRIDRLNEAAAIMAAAPRDAASLVDADAWWIERRALSREVMAGGNWKLAYQIASGHSAESPSNVADAEFHAGWYALRGLGDAKLAAKHFQRIAEVAGGPISLSRAYYWLGRSADDGGPGDRRALYEKAANFGTTFYGQLAAQKLGAETIKLQRPQASAGEEANFIRREAIRAIDRLESVGATALADRFYRHVAEQLSSPGELSLLATRAEQRGNHYLALRVGKIAANRGLDIGALSHPMGAIPASASIDASGAALAYAIARQESEFNTGAVSGAGALGLLQLLPGTAKDVARRAGLPFSRERLTTDAGYNATLGSAFLGEQLKRFDGSYVLTFAGYNAGPRRAQEWIEAFGDPRGKDVDTVVDWIERIPYTETRSYVQRVMENYQVYKALLTGKTNIATDLSRGRG